MVIWHNSSTNNRLLILPAVLHVHVLYIGPGGRLLTMHADDVRRSMTANMSALQLVGVLLLISNAPSVHPYPTGAPQQACMTATPNHPAALAPQTSTNPYSIDLSVFDDGSGSYSYLPRRTYQCEFSRAKESGRCR